MSDFQLSDLEAIVAARAATGDGTSYTAKLVAGGAAKAGKKLGEEAVELVIAGLSEDAKAVTGEAADLLYHLMVLLHLRGVPLSDVTAELGRRTAQSGLEEKAGRAKRGGGRD